MRCAENSASLQPPSQLDVRKHLPANGKMPLHFSVPEENSTKNPQSFEVLFVQVRARCSAVVPVLGGVVYKGSRTNNSRAWPCRQNFSKTDRCCAESQSLMQSEGYQFGQGLLPSACTGNSHEVRQRLLFSRRKFREIGSLPANVDRCGTNQCVDTPLFAMVNIDAGWGA